MVKVIVTGGAGFIGSHLVDALIERGDEVIVVDNFSTGKRENVNLKAELIEFDICHSSVKSVFKNCENIDYVFHLAALPRVPFSFHYPVETNDVNIRGTLNVIALTVLVNAKRLIYSSSSSIYGNQPILPLGEDMAVNPLSPYALQKFAGEKYCQLLCEPNKPNRLNGAVCLRYFNVYGPRQSESTAVVGIFLENRKQGRCSIINGDGEQTRDFTWVSDVARANILAAESDKVGNGEVINIGGGKNYSINQLARMIGGAYEHGPARPGDLLNTLASITKAKELLDWEPAVSLPEGIAKLKKIYGLI